MPEGQSYAFARLQGLMSTKVEVAGHFAEPGTAVVAVFSTGKRKTDWSQQVHEVITRRMARMKPSRRPATTTCIVRTRPRAARDGTCCSHRCGIASLRNIGWAMSPRWPQIRSTSPASWPCPARRGTRCTRSQCLRVRSCGNSYRPRGRCSALPGRVRRCRICDRCSDPTSTAMSMPSRSATCEARAGRALAWSCNRVDTCGPSRARPMSLKLCRKA